MDKRFSNFEAYVLLSSSFTLKLLNWNYLKCREMVQKLFRLIVRKNYVKNLIDVVVKDKG